MKAVVRYDMDPPQVHFCKRKECVPAAAKQYKITDRHEWIYIIALRLAHISKDSSDDSAYGNFVHDPLEI